MSSQARESIVNAYRTLSKIPSVVSGYLSNNGSNVCSKWSVRNLDKLRTSNYVYTYVLDDKLNVIGDTQFGVNISNELISCVSPRDTFRAVITEEKETKDGKKQYLEIWQKNLLLNCIDLTALDIHGDVYGDSEFGSLSWSLDENSLVYIAERKKRKCEPYIKRKHLEDTSKSKDLDEEPSKGDSFLYKQDWGEQLGGKYYSVIVVFHLNTEKFAVLKGLDDSLCPGQVRFAPDGNSVVGVAWETCPRRLGLIYCTNRPGFIFNLTLDGNLTKLSADGLAVRSPRFSPNGDLVWLQRSAGGPHHACHALVVLKNGSKQVSIIIDIVETELAIANGDVFHGLYCVALSNNCFSEDGKRIILSTPQQNEIRSYAVDIDGGRIVNISNSVVLGSTKVLDVKSDVILTVFTNMTTPNQLYVARLPEQGKESEIKWVRLSKPIDTPQSLKDSTTEYMHLIHSDAEDSVKSFSAIYFAPNIEGKKLPTVVWPHGGPHSNFVNAFSLETAIFNMMGFATVQINYRGSTGAGQASVEFLPRRVGDTDVKDCKLATGIALQSYPINEKSLFLFGGSHGGFLVTHLSGQYPEMYRAVVSRNPVIDVATMYNSTDIADWCAVEAGYEFTEKGPVSEEQLLAMRRCSPLVHVHRVKAPTALMLGSEDKRVPHYQGLDYARRLIANGVETRIYMYEDNHSLSSVPAEIDNLINSIGWFMDHMD